MNTYIKYKNTWWRYDENTPIYSATIFSNSNVKLSNINITEFETTTANSFMDLDWTNTPIFSNKYRTGWLSPEGVFYGCDYHFHDDQAFLIHKKDERDLEYEGWVKISYDLVKNGIQSDKLEAFFNSDNEMTYPTNKQISYISSHYSGRDKECMITNLFHIRAYKTQHIKEDWGIER